LPPQVPLLYAIGAPLDAHIGGIRRPRWVNGAPPAATNVVPFPPPAPDPALSHGARRFPRRDVSAAEVDALHAAFCKALVNLFDAHKAAYGWGHKKLVLV